MFLKIRSFFRRMTVREQFLLNAFIWVILIVCFFELLKWNRDNMERHSNVSAILDEQKSVFEKKPTIDAELKDILERFDTTKTFDDSRLSAKVDEGREIGLYPNFRIPRKTSGDALQIYSVRVKLGRAPIDKILLYENMMRREYPYISVENIKLSADGRDPKLLNAEFIINSFALKQSSEQ